MAAGSLSQLAVMVLFNLLNSVKFLEAFVFRELRLVLDSAMQIAHVN